MSARPSQKVSARARVFFLVLFAFALAVLMVSGARPSKATLQTAADASHKRTRPAFVPGEALVRYKSEAVARRKAPAMMLSANNQDMAVQVEHFEGAEIVPGLRLARMEPERTLDAIEALNKQPDVLYAEPNYLLYKDDTPNDPRFGTGELYGLTKIGAPLAWNTTHGSSAVVVGVIDEGVDRTHQDLTANIWINPGEIPANAADDDNNGFVDDVNGFNFAADSGIIPGEFHATHVAGTIGAVGNNNTGVVGVNWNVRLMSLRFINGSNGDTADAIRAVNYAKLMRDRWISSGGVSGANVRVLNNSYGGGGFDQSFLDAINGANQSGILFVAAAGNRDNPGTDDGNNDIGPHFPSSYNAPNVIAVASTDAGDNLSGFSHFGATSVHMGAPGSSILSTTPGNNYQTASGTSMASPHVAGAAALLLAANPNLTVQQLRSLLVFNGDLISALSGITQTGRRLNVGNSFAALAENDVTPPGTATNFHLNSQNGRALNIGWTASGDDGAAGQASLYQVTFTDSTSGAVILLKSIVPVAAGSSQAIDIKLPYRHIAGTLKLREFDNVGNEGTPASFPVSVNPAEGDPYVAQEGGPAALSTGGAPLGLIGDDELKLNYALPFSFPFFGQNFSSVNISTNGNLFFSTPPTRENGDADDVPSSSIGLGQFKMISGLWDDLRTDGRGSDDVYVVMPDATRIIFRWQGEIFGDGTSPANQPQVNFEIELRSNGTILTRYGAGNTNTFPVVGISGGEPEAYVVFSHTSEQFPISLTNAPAITFLPRPLEAGSNVQLATAQFNVDEATPAATVTVTRSGDTTTQASVDYNTIDGSAKQKNDYMFGTGTLTFAPGESSKSFSVLIVNDTYQEGTESFSVSLSNPVGTSIGAGNTAAVVITDDDTSPSSVHPLDAPDESFFVREQYMDFLNREPDSDGLNYWISQITSCGSDQACISNKKVNVSAAFFLSIEFQETGYLVYRTYKAAFGDAQGSAIINNVSTPISVPVVRFGEFLTDTNQIGNGVQVGIGNWPQVLENNKQAYMLAFVQRSQFATVYPPSLMPADFVDTLFQKAGIMPTGTERQDAISEFGTSFDTSNIPARARVLRLVAENDRLKVNERNRAFVLMQYFGYLRRNPNDSPDSDHSGWKFWLDKLELNNGNFVSAQMVLAFLDSIEYRNRFAP